jgi:capsule polysaccharide export protein KpsE/RkpR
MNKSIQERPLAVLSEKIKIVVDGLHGMDISGFSSDELEQFTKDINEHSRRLNEYSTKSLEALLKATHREVMEANERLKSL